MDIIGKRFYLDFPPNRRWAGNAKLLRAKWPYPHDANGEEIEIVKKQVGTTYKARMINYPGYTFMVSSRFIKLKKEIKTCKCDVFVTGCICGYFEHEQGLV